MELLYEKQLAEVVTQRLQGELEVVRKEVRALAALWAFIPSLL